MTGSTANPTLLRKDSGLQVLDSYYLLCGNDFALKPGMVYCVSPTVIAKNSDDTILGGTTVVITENGYCELGNRAVEFLIAAP